jgi:hypothetical protein
MVYTPSEYSSSEGKKERRKERRKEGRKRKKTLLSFLQPTASPQIWPTFLF